MKNIVSSQFTHLGSYLSLEKGLKIKWFDHWHPELDEALKTLPELANFPHSLYSQLVQNPCSVQKRIALITHHGEPVSVVGLRANKFSWVPVTQWILPGMLFPVKPGYCMPSLEKIPLDIWVGWWRQANPLPASRQIRYCESTPVYKMKLDENMEKFWRETGLFKTLRQDRNRCRCFTIKLNQPGSAEWTIRNWEKKWRSNPNTETSELADRLFLGKALEDLGKQYTLSIYDKDEIIGGATCLVDGDELVAGVNYRKPEYEWHGLGNRLIEAVFEFFAGNKYKCFDMGGGHDYKKRWAPEDGERCYFNICPDYIYQAKQLARGVLSLPHKLLKKEA
jgi:hypothetical protein